MATVFIIIRCVAVTLWSVSEYSGRLRCGLGYG